MKIELERAHALIMKASLGPNMALVKGKASKSALRDSAANLRQALKIIEGIVGAQG